MVDKNKCAIKSSLGQGLQEKGQLEKHSSRAKTYPKRIKKSSVGEHLQVAADHGCDLTLLFTDDSCSLCPSCPCFCQGVAMKVDILTRIKRRATKRGVNEKDKILPPKWPLHLVLRSSN